MSPTKLLKPARITAAVAFTLVSSLLLGACGSAAGAAELESAQAQLTAAQAELDALIYALQAAESAEFDMDKYTALSNESIAEQVQVVPSENFFEMDGFIAVVSSLHDGWDDALTTMRDKLVLNCMADKGFTYPETLFSLSRHVFTTIGESTREYAETYGLGINPREGRGAMHEFFQALPRTEADAFSTATRDCEWFANEVERAMWDVTFRDEFRELYFDVANVRWQMDSFAAHITNFNAAWSVCLADTGFSAEVGELIDAHEARPSDEVEWMTFSPAHLRGFVDFVLEPTLDEEIAIAVASWDCRNQLGESQMLAEMNQEIIETAIAQFGPEIQQWFGAVNQSIAEVKAEFAG